MHTKLSLATRIAVILALTCALQPGFAKPSNKKDHRPNIVLLVVDDMGYSDLPLFGGEADTPNIDNLAAAGITFNNFHVLPACSPTRSVLLSGVDNHLNGLGTMSGRLGLDEAVNQRGQPGYEGYLNDRVATGPDLLRAAGYHTYMAGKWHLADTEEEDGFRRGTWPIDRGFERSTGVMEGEGDQFGRPEFPRARNGRVHYFEDDHYLTEGFPPPGFYSTKNYTQKIIEYIDSNRQDGKPFFVYWAPNTPHWPHQAPDEQIDKYVARGIYEQGWDAVREQRFNRIKQLGIIPANTELPPRAPFVPAWDDPTDQAWQPFMNSVLPYQDVWGIQDMAGLKRTLAKDMAVYTAMIDSIDMEIGNLIKYLKQIGEYNNTIFVFLSDNGADGANVTFNPLLQPALRDLGVDNRLENLGGPGSMVSYVSGWAQVSNTPFFSAKLATGEAGIRAPLVIAYPGNRHVVGNQRSNALVTVQDILPTLLRYARVRHPAGPSTLPDESRCVWPYEGRTICPMNGKSMVNLLEGRTRHVYGPLSPVGFELFGTVNKALVRGEWKILRLGDRPWGAGQQQPWKLFNLRRDPAELEDVSFRFPVRLQNMISAYERYEDRVGFIPVVDNSKRAGLQRIAPDAIELDDTGPIEFKYLFDN